MLEELEKNGIKLWIVSADKQSITDIDYSAVGLFENYHQPFCIEGSSFRNIENSIK